MIHTTRGLLHWNCTYAITWQIKLERKMLLTMRQALKRYTHTYKDVPIPLPRCIYTCALYR